MKQVINTMHTMVLQIVKATKEQKAASEHVMQMTEDISRITKRIKDTTFEQSKQGIQISSSLSGISDEIREIGASVNKKAKEVENVSQATNDVKDIANRSIEYNNDLSSVAKNFLDLSNKLKNELSHFTLKNDK